MYDPYVWVAIRKLFGNTANISGAGMKLGEACVHIWFPFRHFSLVDHQELKRFLDGWLTKNPCKGESA